MASAAGLMPTSAMDSHPPTATSARVNIAEYKKRMHAHTQNLMRQSTRERTAESSSNSASLRSESSTDSATSIDSTRS